MKLLDQITFKSTVVKSSDTSMIHCLKKYDSTSAFYFHLVHVSTQSLKTQTQNRKRYKINFEGLGLIIADQWGTCASSKNPNPNPKPL